ncbi:MAG: hypothetical protein N3A38_11435, partial [Planctomycetota bacterium]|nr:hypothetical protein [Planctomycetota bacterium]
LADPGHPMSDYFTSTVDTVTGQSSTLAVVGPLRLRLFSGYVAAKKNEPLAKFLALSYGEWMDNATIRYEQGAALAWYLINGSGGRYREAFANYVMAYYHGRAADAGALPRFLRVKLEDFEREWVTEMSKIKPIY